MVVLAVVLVGGLAAWMATRTVDHYQTLGYQLPRSGLASILAASGLVIVCCVIFAVARSVWLRVGAVVIAVPALALSVISGTQPPVVSCHAGWATLDSRAWWGATMESGGPILSHRPGFEKGYAAGYYASFAYTCRGNHLAVFRRVG
jgi:hypothetical protein